MYSWEYSEKALLRISAFIEYKSINCKYRDTGLFNENLIVANYIANTYKFIDELKEHLDKYLPSWFIWVIQEKKWDIEIRKVVCSVRSYNIVLICEYNHKSKTILILDIIITS